MKIISIILIIILILTIAGCSNEKNEPPYFVFEEGNFINDKNNNNGNTQLKVINDVGFYNVAGTCFIQDRAF